jgi:ligand-binding SRPBCC domain-containing protein
VPIRWQSEITVLEPPHRFVDEQRRGPFRTWHHEHRFAALTEGRTKLLDSMVPAALQALAS